MHTKKKLQKKRKFVGLEWQAALSAMRTWISGHPDTRINSRIRVSADPPDRQMPVSAACVRVLKKLVNLGANYPGSASICGFFLGVLGGSILSVSIHVHPWFLWASTFYLVS
jgi:hypothetical protein